jgi:hypothetical protein
MTAISGKNTSTELQQVVAHILDTAAMAATIVYHLQTEMTRFAKEMSEIEARFPGFSTRLDRHIEKEVRRAVSQRAPDLRAEFEDFLMARLTPDEIGAAHEFQRDRVVARLRESTLVMSLETDGRSDAKLSERMSAGMSPEQHAVVDRFLKSPCGMKLALLTRQMETLKYDWMQAIVSGISQRLHLIGKEILQKHYVRQPK